MTTTTKKNKSKQHHHPDDAFCYRKLTITNGHADFLRFWERENIYIGSKELDPRRINNKAKKELLLEYRQRPEQGISNGKAGQLHQQMNNPRVDRADLEWALRGLLQYGITTVGSDLKYYLRSDWNTAQWQDLKRAVQTLDNQFENHPGNKRHDLKQAYRHSWWRTHSSSSSQTEEETKVSSSSSFTAESVLSSLLL